jgi:hypothetical protein
MSILTPRSLTVVRCAITGLPQIFKLTSWVRTQIEGKPTFQLNLESQDLTDKLEGFRRSCIFAISREWLRLIRRMRTRLSSMLILSV